MAGASFASDRYRFGLPAGSTAHGAARRGGTRGDRRGRVAGWAGWVTEGRGCLQRWFPLHDKYHAGHDLVPAWVNPALAALPAVALLSSGYAVRPAVGAARERAQRREESQKRQNNVRKHRKSRQRRRSGG
ncbi:hypothetical protein ACFTWN_10710 [Streptomyces sp. NPDC057092]